MIVSFRHRGLRRLFEDDDPRRLPPEQVEKIAVILARLDAAEQIGDMNAPGLRLHRLAGKLKGFWSVAVTANWGSSSASTMARRSRSTSSTIIEAAAMPMKNPPHPGRHIRLEYLEPLGLSVTEAARVLGVTRANLSNIVNGKSGISPEMAVRLAKAFGGTAEIWLRLQAGYDLAQVRRREADIKVEPYHPPAA
jgi:antitoxin HigA-1